MLQFQTAGPLLWLECRLMQALVQRQSRDRRPQIIAHAAQPEADQKRHMMRLWLKFPKVWPLSAEFPTHMGYKPSKDTPELIEAER